MGSGRAKIRRIFGVANLEPVERDKYSGFSVNRVNEDKRRPKEARKYDNQ